MKQVFVLKEPLGKINCSSDIFTKLKKIDIDYSQENFICFYLNTANMLVKSEVLFKGGINSCSIDPRIIFKHCLLNDCCKIIIAHNHPSGSLSPSYEDNDFTNELMKMGELLDLKVLDSIIFNKKEFYSLNNE